MEVRFRKGKDGRTCAWVAMLPKRQQVPGPTMAAGPDLPHDLSTFVIEEALGFEHGFWGCVAEGARFRSLGRKRTPQGTAVVARHADELDEAERRVNEVYFAWRRGEPTEVDGAIEAMLARWRAHDEDEELVVEWQRNRASGRHGRS
jgi:hypothetical protein